MAKTKIQEIVEILETKSCAKQQAYEQTLEVLNEFKKVLKGYESNLKDQVQGFKDKLEIEYREAGKFEAHMQFAGDTLVLMMHTNVFDFDSSHFIHKMRYVREDKTREYCGLIQVYNFLSDSLKYQRYQDQGVLVARIFVNREGHFFIDGRRPLGFLYNDFEHLIINEKHINNIIEEAILFCLNLDLMVPPFDDVGIITVEQQTIASYSSGFHTTKQPLGFQIHAKHEEKKE
ncbi:MAG: hypothetical protein LPK45_10250 [Bacteroidota bacterium]|nr:hypothetical protein [Bacteroidota bacterium]MDX5431478.1 hypothetical protein [Bacteroidota bacterium]MDX5470202.1 hypothetical protein [Bacteroidota bacterium]